VVRVAWRGSDTVSSVFGIPMAGQGDGTVGGVNDTAGEGLAGVTYVF